MNYLFHFLLEDKEVLIFVQKQKMLHPGWQAASENQV